MKSIRARAPSASSAAVRRVMQANVGRTTSVELRLRRTLHRMGLWFRKDIRPDPRLRCKADIVLPSSRICIFVDGCFWHGCQMHFKKPKTNADWWDEKIQANIRRDQRQTALLQARGWEVVRVWEHELEGEELQIVGMRIFRLAREKAVGKLAIGHF